MHALFFDGNSSVHIEELPVPERRTGEVLVQIAYSGVCETEFKEYRGEGSPDIPGHEFTGKVVEVGPETMRYKVGDRVVCYPFRPCGTCPVCRSGNTHICPDSTNLWHLRQGGFAEYISLPEPYYLPLPDDIPDDVGVLVPEIFGTMYRGLRLMRIKPGEIVAVVGLQPYGLGAVRILKLLGARVAAFDVTRYRRAMASRLGADVTIDSTEPGLFDRIQDMTKGAMFDHIVECDEPILRLERLFVWIRPGGTICLMGHAGHSFELDPDTVWRNEITVIGTPTYHPSEHEQVLDTLRRCPDADSIITHRPRLQDTKEALDEYVIDRAGKIAIDMT